MKVVSKEEEHPKGANSSPSVLQDRIGRNMKDSKAPRQAEHQPWPLLHDQPLILWSLPVPLWL